MNENEFQEISKEILPEKNENFNIAPEQKARLVQLYSEYKYKNSIPKKENFFTRHNTSFIIALASVSLLIFAGCIIYDISAAEPPASPAISDNDRAEADDSFDDIIIEDDDKSDKIEENDDDDDEIKTVPPTAPHIKNENAPTLNISEIQPPDADSEYIDSNGKYTTEGIAIAVRPSIVQIYTYTDKNEFYGSGSGIIMTDDGYIITNAHVIDDSAYFEVITDDEKHYDGQIVGKDRKTDLAVIKIDAKGLVPAQFGNSDDVLLGEQVMAIGNPGGLTGSITGGYVSGLNRKIKSDSTGFEMDCIQTDAAISPGNSGGALVNMYGQVIGITSSKYVSSSFEGLGFAITTQEAKPVIDELLSNGFISGRYKIGIKFYNGETAAAILAQEKGYEYPENISGLLIAEIDKDCDISNTELKKWDIITEIEGMEVYDYQSITEALDGKEANDSIKAHVVRITDDNGNTEEFDILFMLMPDTSGDY
ncbi:MAG: S1C family serine protease [Oscillospiraceae bacterium]